MKNHRDVCAASEAGYAEFNGLPGKIKTGCTNTPQLKSRYCPAHTPTAFKRQVVDINSEAAECATLQPNTKEDQVAYIVGKKKTRQNTFYEVRTHMNVATCINVYCSYVMYICPPATVQTQLIQKHSFISHMLFQVHV